MLRLKLLRYCYLLVDPLQSRAACLHRPVGISAYPLAGLYTSRKHSNFTSCFIVNLPTVGILEQTIILCSLQSLPLPDFSSVTNYVSGTKVTEIFIEGLLK